MGRKIVVFDGVCNLCNRAVAFLIKYDTNQSLQFASFQSPEIASYLLTKNIEVLEPQSMLFIHDDQIFDKSDAVYELLNYIPRLKFLRILFFLPSTINHKIYNFVAKYRYRIFGRSNQCMIHTPNMSHRFITKL